MLGHIVQKHLAKPSRLRSSKGFAAAVVLAVICVTPLVADPAASETITSSGPLTVTVSPDLNCDVRHTADRSPEFYGGTACGTLVAASGTLYGPASIPAGGGASPRTPFTAVSQSVTSGDGSATNPYRFTTVVDGGTALRVTETDAYIVGREYYRTDVKVTNRTGSPVEATIYRAGDCYLQNSDVGFGSVDSARAGSAVACVGALVDENGSLVYDSEGRPQKGSRIEQWIPLTAGSHYYQAGYSSVWGAIGSRMPFPDTCLCDAFIDNGAGLSWTVSIPAGGSTTVSHLTAFSPNGDTPLDYCGELGLAALGNTGIASGLIHDTVEPALPDALAKQVHSVNCTIVVPVETAINGPAATSSPSPLGRLTRR